MPLQIDRLRTVPDLADALLRGGDEEVPLRFRWDDEELLRRTAFRDEHELHLPAFHGLARLRVQVIVPHVAATVDEGADLDLALLRGGQDLVRERGHGDRVREGRGPGKALVPP